MFAPRSSRADEVCKAAGGEICLGGCFLAAKESAAIDKAYAASCKKYKEFRTVVIGQKHRNVARVAAFCPSSD